MLNGIISSVTTRSLGSSLAAPAALGDSTLTLDQVVDFADEGGQVQVIGPSETPQLLTYTAVDRDAGVLTLSGALGTALDDETFVAVYPLGSRQLASVIVDEESAPSDVDTIEALVPFVMRAMLPDGIREDPETAESVILDIVADEWQIIDLRNQPPRIEREALVVVGGEVPPTPAGLVATAGPGLITVSWNGTFVDGAEAPIDYSHTAIHIAQKSEVDGAFVVLPSSHTHAASFMTLEGGQVTLARTADIAYYVGLVAVSLSGKWSDISTLATVTPAPVVSTGANGKPVFWGTEAEMLAAAYPWTDGSTWFNSDAGNAPSVWRNGGWAPATFGDGAIANLNVSKLVGDQLNGNLIIGGSIRTATEGNRVEMDWEGIRLYDGANRRSTTLSSWGDSTFTGQVRALGVEVDGKLKVNSDSEISPGADLVLLEGYSSPANQPQLENYWDKTSIHGVSDVYGITRDSANGDWVVSSFHTNGTQMKITRHDGASGELTSTVGYVNLNSGTYPRYGVAIAGGKVWVPRDITSGNGSQLVATDGTVRTFAALGAGRITGLGQASGNDVAVIYTQPGGDYYDYQFCTFNTSTSAKSNVTPIDGNVSSSYGPCVAYGSFDLGYSSFARINPSGPSFIDFITPVTGAVHTEDTFFSLGAWLAVGYYAGSFWTTTDGITIRHHTTDKVSTPAFAYTWLDNDPGGTGTHETAYGPWSAPGYLRAKWEVVTSEIPAATNNDTPNAARVVARQGSGSVYVQGVLDSTNALLVEEFDTSTVFTKGADFPASGTPGTIRSQSGHIVLPGVGRPTIQGVTNAIEVAYNTDLNTLNIPGIYGVRTNGLTDAQAQTLHYPSAGNFLLEVLEGVSSYPIQRLMKQNDFDYTVYLRKTFLYLGNFYWSTWGEVGAVDAPDVFQATITTAQSMGANTNTVTAWNVTENGFGVSNYAAGVLKVPAGRYTVSAGISFSTQSTRRFFQILINNVIRTRFEGPVTGYSSGVLTLDGIVLGANTTIAVQTYGAAAPTINGTLAPATFSVRYLGPTP